MLDLNVENLVKEMNELDKIVAEGGAINQEQRKD